MLHSNLQNLGEKRQRMFLIMAGEYRPRFYITLLSHGHGRFFSVLIPLCTVKIEMLTITQKYLNKWTHSQTTNFKIFQTERVYRRQFQIWWKWQKVLQTDRKRCGKRRNCSLRAISPFPTAFSKELYCRHEKTGLVWKRVKLHWMNRN